MTPKREPLTRWQVVAVAFIVGPLIFLFAAGCVAVGVALLRWAGLIAAGG